MSQYNGYRIIAHASYDEYRAATIGNGYNVDYDFGNQCWDYISLLYYQYGMTLITKAGGGIAADCWNYSRAINSRPPFTSLEGVQNIKRGDIIVTNKSPISSTGHICIADEDYRTTGDTTKIWTIGQNPTLHGLNGTVSRDEVKLTYFLGIFRNTEWESAPTPPTPAEETQKIKKRKYPWPIALHHWRKF